MRLEDRDATVAFDEGTQETILEIEVRGKRGYGPCKSTQNAVSVFNRLKKRNKPQPTDRIFPKYHHAMFKRVLEEEGLKFDRRRTAPHTLQPAAHLHLLPPDGGCRHLPDRQELPYQRRDDREVLCRPPQERARRQPPSTSGSRSRRRRKWRKSAEASWRPCGELINP